jgi:hypothetical protein
VNLIARVKNILLTPREEWPRIAAEAATVQSLYLRYVLILAAIGPLATFVSFAVLGLGLGLGAAIFAYLHALIGVAIVALIVDALAPRFGGTRDYVRALKLTAYSFTALWVAQIALLIPVAGALIALIGLVYSLYLFFLGVPVLGKSAAEKAIPFTIVVIVCAIVVMYLIGLIARTLGFGFGAAAPMAVGPMGLPR